MWSSSEEPSRSLGGGARSQHASASPAPGTQYQQTRVCVHPLPAPALTNTRCRGWVSAYVQLIKDMALLFTPSHCSPKFPPAHPVSSSPSPSPSFHHGINQQLLFQPPWKKCLLPLRPTLLCPPATGGMGAWVARQACAWPVCPSVRLSCGSPAPGADVSAPGSRAVGGRHRSYCIKNNTAEHKFITDKCDSQEELTSPSLSA